MRLILTDSGLDVLLASVDARFDDLNARISDLTARVDGLQHTMVHGFIAMMVAMITGFMCIAGLIIAKL